MAKLVWIMLSILLVRLLPIPTAPVAEIRPESIVACVSADDKSDFVCLGSVTELDGYSRTSSVTAEAPIGVNAYLKGSDDSFYLSDDEIEDYMHKLAQVIVFP